MTHIAIPSVDILKNRGFMLRVHSLERNDTTGKWERRTSTDDSFIFENKWVKFTNWTITSLEADQPLGFGSIPAWEGALEINPTTSIIKTYAILNDMFSTALDGTPQPDLQWAAHALEDNRTAEYFVIFSNAMFLANGMDPDVVVRLARQGLKEHNEILAKRNIKVVREIEADNEKYEDNGTQTSPSPQTSSDSSTESGSKQEEVQTTSGV